MLFRKKITFCDYSKKIVKYGLDKIKQTAYISSSIAMGMIYIKKENLNPLKMTSFGLGELILDALDHNAKKIVIGIGGTCTNDGGMGLLQALGVKFFCNDEELIGNGSNLIKINRIDLSSLDKRLFNVEIIASSDVENYLCGENGATKCYGKQKGADDKMIDFLEEGMKNYAYQTQKFCHIDLLNIIGGGSGGGLSAAIKGYLNGKIVSGFEYLSNQIHLEEKIKDADLIITGEGKIDQQTLNGKTPYRVYQLAKKYNKKIIFFCGLKENDYLFKNVYALENKPIHDYKNTYKKLVLLSEKVLKKEIYG